MNLRTWTRCQSVLGEGKKFKQGLSHGRSNIKRPGKKKYQKNGQRGQWEKRNTQDYGRQMKQVLQTEEMMHCAKCCWQVKSDEDLQPATALSNMQDTRDRDKCTFGRMVGVETDQNAVKTEWEGRTGEQQTSGKSPCFSTILFFNVIPVSADLNLVYLFSSSVTHLLTLGMAAMLCLTISKGMILVFCLLATSEQLLSTYTPPITQ